MEKSKQFEIDTQLIFRLFALLLIGKLLFSQFDYKVARQIKKRAKGKCEHCGKRLESGHSVAAHLDHQKGEQYNDPKNGRAWCLPCEVGYHLLHIDNPEKIGMTRTHNLNAIRGQYQLLRKDEQVALTKRFGVILTSIIRQ